MARWNPYLVFGAPLQNSPSAIVNLVIPTNVSRVFENSLERSP